LNSELFVVPASVNFQHRFIWYFRRLRLMELREITWRARLFLHNFKRHDFEHKALLKDQISWEDSFNKFRSEDHSPVLFGHDAAKSILGTELRLSETVVSAANTVSEGVFTFFGYPAARLERPLNWHFDPMSRFHWPDIPSMRINHRAIDADVKWIWELNRLQHLAWLSQAWLFTGDRRYSSTAFEHIDSWIEQNQPGRGIAWRGAFEAGLRAISISLSLQGLRNSPDFTLERYKKITGVLTYSAKRCWYERSRFSSSNNHLIGEMAGLAVIAIVFPELCASQRWEKESLWVLEQEANKQILQDGVGSEQSIGYQIATVELLHLVASLLIARDGEAPREIVNAIDRSSYFLARIVGVGDPDPKFGDCDHQFALRVGPETTRTIREHLGITNTLLRYEKFESLSAKTMSSIWFKHLLNTWQGHLPSVPDCSVGEVDLGGFYSENGGLVVLRRDGMRITMDVGPLGYLSIAAHGHADALSISLSHDGKNVIGDPGTGSYYRHPEQRSIMRGTRAHATVCIDGKDQSLNGGAFLWYNHAVTHVNEVNIESGIIDAEHDGYNRLSGLVKHRRRLISPPGNDFILILDLITGRGTHSVKTNWPIHPTLSIYQNGNGHIITDNDCPLFQVLHASNRPFKLDDSYGDKTSGLGWWSDQLESREPAWWIGASILAKMPIAVATLITAREESSPTEFSIAQFNAGFYVKWFDKGIQHGYSINP
jgi:hypothetical protein